VLVAGLGLQQGQCAGGVLGPVLADSGAYTDEPPF
jgi:hypothetical protein